MQIQCASNASNAIPMQIHSNPTQIQRNSNATPTQIQCKSNAIPMQLQRKSNATPMHIQCASNVGAVSRCVRGYGNIEQQQMYMCRGESQMDEEDKEGGERSGDKIGGRTEDA
eukprot:7014936-Pyramimonas_sp.AAC.1